jgi:hypothetical protein
VFGWLSHAAGQVLCVIVACDGLHEPAVDAEASFRKASPRSRIVLVLRASRATALIERGGADEVIDAVGDLDGIVAAGHSVIATQRQKASS